MGRWLFAVAVCLLFTLAVPNSEAWAQDPPAPPPPSAVEQSDSSDQASSDEPPVPDAPPEPDKPPEAKQEAAGAQQAQEDAQEDAQPQVFDSTQAAVLQAVVTPLGTALGLFVGAIAGLPVITAGGCVDVCAAYYVPVLVGGSLLGSMTAFETGEGQGGRGSFWTTWLGAGIGASGALMLGWLASTDDPDLFGPMTVLMSIPTMTVGTIVGYHYSVPEPAAQAGADPAQIMVGPAPLEDGFGLGATIRW